MLQHFWMSWRSVVSCWPRRGSPHIFHFFLLFLVFCVHGGPCHGDVCRFPAAELGAEVGGAAGDDRHLFTADRSFLHLTVCSLRHSSPQHGVSVWDVYESVITSVPDKGMYDGGSTGDMRSRVDLFSEVNAVNVWKLVVRVLSVTVLWPLQWRSILSM